MPKQPLQLGSIARPDVLLARARHAAEENRWHDAIDLLKRIIAIDPTHLEAINALAKAHKEVGELSAAGIRLGDSLRIDPSQIEIWKELGELSARVGHLDHAMACFDEIVKIQPGHISAHERRADIFFLMGRYAESARIFEELVKYVPHNWLGLGNALNWLGRTEDAFEAYSKAEEIPEVALSATVNKGLLLIRRGDLPAGFRLFERRWDLPILGGAKPASDRPLWLGETSLAGKVLYIHWEQGLGDTIHFCRYVSMAADAGARVILEVPHHLYRLMGTLRGVDQLILGGQPIPDHDLRCPTVSLPLAFNTTIDTIPGDVPYLSADPQAAAVWKERLRDIKGKRIGLIWAGESRIGDIDTVNADRRRSTTLMKLAPLADVADCAFFSLQLGPPAAQAKSPPAGMTLHDYTSELRDFADTAALVENLDLVISVDTSPAHLAGAIGKPVWLLNRFDTCWRWFMERSDTPWYPTMRIFRQPKPGDWDSVVTAIAAALAEFAATDQPPGQP